MIKARPPGRARMLGAEQFAIELPIKARPRVRLTARGDVAVTGDALGRDRRIALEDGPGAAGEGGVLHGRKGFGIRSFQFDPDGEVIAARAPAETGAAGVPGRVTSALVLGGTTTSSVNAPSEIFQADSARP